jgi:hypothetical protein
LLSSATGDRLLGFTIGVAMSTDIQDVLSYLDNKDFSIVQTCRHVSGVLRNGEWRHVTCDVPINGSIVVVYFPDDTRPNILTICELDVLGDPSKLTMFIYNASLKLKAVYNSPILICKPTGNTAILL